MKRIVIIALSVTAAQAFAEEPAEEKRASDEPVAADVEGKPVPGQESGRLDKAQQRDSTLRNIGQGVLFVPRVAVETVFAPVRGGLWLYDRYSVSVSNRFKRTFFDDTETYGLYPTLHADTTYGLTVGGRLVHRSLFGAREKLSVRGGAGGEFRQMLDTRIHSGRRFGEDVNLELRGEFERRPRDPFYGIGNTDDAVEVRHRQELLRATTTADVRAVSSLHVRVAGAITDLEYSPNGGLPIDEVYDTSMLTLWPGNRNVYGELELRWDGRRHAGRYDQHGVFNRGVLVGAFAGRVHQLQMGGDYWRYGGTAQHFLPLGLGGRTLHTRAHVESVTGSLADIAFTQLPQLGGTTLLRGYPGDRFRDRAAVLTSAEYFWDLNRLVMASVFVDAGRVYSSLRDFEVEDVRVGYGASLQLHSDRSFVSSVNVASSIDGGVFVSLAFDPVFEPETRVEQK